MAKKANPEGMKWPTDKAKYDRNWIKLFGKPCPYCGGTGGGAMAGWLRCCPRCKGLGKVEK